MENDTAGWSPSVPKDNTLFITVVMSLEITQIFVIVGGNILTICAICRFTTLRYPSNVMIAVLAVSDLLMGLVYIPMALIRNNMPFLFNTRTSCLAILFIGKSLILGNIVFQSTLSLERFYAVQFPFHYHSKVTVRRNLIWSCVAVTGILSITTPAISGIDLWSEHPKCYSPILFPYAYSRFYIGTFLTFVLLGLFAFLRVLVAELRFRRRDRNLQTTDLQKQASIQSTIMVMAYGISLCFYMPHVFYYIWGTFSGAHSDLMSLAIVELLDFCSSAVNCFIYGFKNSKFREAYKRLLGFKSWRIEPDSTL